MEAAGLQRTAALDILPEGKERLVAEREERPVQGGKDSQFVIGPFDRGEGIVESDNLLAIVEGAPTYENVGMRRASSARTLLGKRTAAKPKNFYKNTCLLYLT